MSPEAAATGSRPVACVVGPEGFPAATRSTTTMAAPDYADLFTIEVDRNLEQSPEEWARTILERTEMGPRARALWRFLGLRLGPSGSPDHVQGWRIAARGENWIRVETSGWWAEGEAVCHVDGNRVSIALFLRYRTPLARLVWLPVGALHRQGVPGLLKLGARQARRAAAAASPDQRRAGSLS